MKWVLLLFWTHLGEKVVVFYLLSLIKRKWINKAIPLLHLRTVRQSPASPVVALLYEILYLRILDNVILAGLSESRLSRVSV